MLSSHNFNIISLVWMCVRVHMLTTEEGVFLWKMCLYLYYASFFLCQKKVKMSLYNLSLSLSLMSQLEESEGQVVREREGRARAEETARETSIMMGASSSWEKVGLVLC